MTKITDEIVEEFMRQQLMIATVNGHDFEPRPHSVDAHRHRCKKCGADIGAYINEKGAYAKAALLQCDTGFAFVHCGTHEGPWALSEPFEQAFNALHHLTLT